MNKLWALTLVLAAAVACTCGGAGQGGGAGSGGAGSGSAVPPRDPGAPVDPRCAAARPAIEALYRAEASAAKLEAARAAEMVRDNAEMVMNECASRPEVAACAQKAKSSQALEAECLRPLDDEGSEGATVRD